MEKHNIAKCLEQLWPVALYWLVLMIGDYLVARAAFWASGYTVAIPLSMGYFLGQFCLAAILGGLLGRTWVSGWLIGVVLATVGMALAMMGSRTATSQDPAEQLALLTFAPLLMLAACGPFMAMRGLRGWSLTLGKDTAIVKQRAGVEDLLLLSVIVACSFSLTRIVAKFSPGFSESNQGLIIPAFYFGFSLFFAVPTAWITFRARNWGQRILCWAGIALAVIVVCLAMDWFMSPGGRSTLWSTLKGASIGVGSSAVTVAMGAWAMLASGFKLTHFAKGPALVEAAEDETLALQRIAQRQARWLTGGVALLALLASGWLSLADYRRIKLLEAV